MNEYNVQEHSNKIDEILVVPGARLRMTEWRQFEYVCVKRCEDVGVCWWNRYHFLPFTCFGPFDWCIWRVLYHLWRMREVLVMTVGYVQIYIYTHPPRMSCCAFLSVTLTNLGGTQHIRSKYPRLSHPWHTKQWASSMFSNMPAYPCHLPFARICHQHMEHTHTQVKFGLMSNPK